MRNLARTGNARFDGVTTIPCSTPPRAGGFNLAVAYSVYAGQSAVEDQDADAFSTSLNYAAGPFAASLAYERLKEADSRGERDAVRAAASYNLTDAFRWSASIRPQSMTVLSILPMRCAI